MALRAFDRYLTMRKNAEDNGAAMADLGDHPPTEQIGEQYREAVAEWVFERAKTATAAIALVEFADLIATDQQSDHSMSYAEIDLVHQRVALAGVIHWLRPHTHAEVIAEERKQKPVEVVR